MLVFKVMAVCLFVVLTVGEVVAQEKSTESCEDRLNVEAFTLRNVSEDRASKERALAKAQVRAYWMQQEVSRLKAELQKLQPPKAQKPEEVQP